MAVSREPPADGLGAVERARSRSILVYRYQRTVPYWTIWASIRSLATGSSTSSRSGRLGGVPYAAVGLVAAALTLIGFFAHPEHAPWWSGTVLTGALCSAGYG